MNIHLPNSAFLGNLDSFLKSIDGSDPNHLKITANKKWISVHPVVLAMLAAKGSAMPKDAISCEVLEARSKHYLERMRLFEFLGIDSGITVTEHDPSGRFIPLTQIQDSASLTRFITEMIPMLHLAPVHAEPIRYIVSELVRNVIEHADSPYGAFVAAQYYQKSNTIRIGIADTGVGISQTIRQSHPSSSDLESLRLALTPGITGTTPREGGTEQNAGAGLFFVKSIAAVNGDFFTMQSGSAFFKLLKQEEDKRHILNANPLKDRHTAGDDYPYWQGTAIGIDMALDMNEQFTALLKIIRDVYSRAVRERKQAKYKKPVFV